MSEAARIPADDAWPECDSAPSADTTGSGGESERDRLRYAWKALSVTSLGMLLTGLNSSTLNVALPEIVRHFHAGPFAANWVLLAYMLVTSVSLVVFGRVADLFGRRGTYLAGFAVFTASSLLLGFAPNIGVLIVLRVTQALGGAMILANGSAIITHAFPASRLSQGMGAYMAVISVGQLVGPSVGGFVAGVAGWQWIFWFNVPIGIAAIVWGAVSLRRVPADGGERLDVPGIVVLWIWLGGLLLALSEGSARGWGGPLVIGGAVAFAVGLPVFWYLQRRAAAPVIDPRLFADRSFTTANIAAVLNTLSRFSVILLVALYLQSARGYGPAEAGVAVLPMPGAMTVASLLAGGMSRRFAPRAVAVAGSAVATAGLVVLYFAVQPSTPYVVLVPALVLIGAGSGLFLTANTTVIMADAPRDRLGVVNGIRLMLVNVSTMLSTGLCLAIAASALAREDRGFVYSGDITSAPKAIVSELLSGYERAIVVLLALSILATIASYISRRGDTPSTP
ncbi:MAG TPA: MFS transporter [Streptosporangiaceae bacterium]|jgi:EmrB/QacA subfamily drug resistance transporter